jgi:soluble lytic murein transglycosylase-like protein
MMVDPSPHSDEPRPRGAGLKRDALSLLTGVALGAAALLLSRPAHADVIEIGQNGAFAVRSGAGSVRWSGPADDSEEAIGDVAILPDALTPIASAAVPQIYAAALARIAEANDMSPALLAALVWQESRWRADAVSRAGAVGLTQLMPDTARHLGVDPRDPIANLAGGARYLRQQLDLFDGDIEKALAAYNAGPARVLRAGGIPAIAETRTYVAAIVGRLTPTRE